MTTATAQKAPLARLQPVAPMPLWERHKLFQEPTYAHGYGFLEDDEDDSDSQSDTES